MIERLTQSEGQVFGLKVTGKATAEEVAAIETQLEFAVAKRGKRPIAILADLSEAHGADWKGRWEEIRFLSKYADHVERLAVVGAHAWEEVLAACLAATILLRAETRYFRSSEIQHAWHWAKTGRHADDVPVRQIQPAKGLMGGYAPEYSGQ
jgi:hypothetical protein